MDFYSLIVRNKWVLEILYALIVSSVCMIIVLKSDKFFKLSEYPGIRYFRNAFFFYGIAFIARYILGLFSDWSFDYLLDMNILFEYFMVMAGFFLLYSLIWKNFKSKEGEKSSLFNKKIIIFHIMALLIALIDGLNETYFLMFLSQIAIFSYTSVVSYINYKKNKSRHKFTKFYFFAMLMSLLAWVLNLIVAFYLDWDKRIMISIGVMNIIFFLLILYGVMRFTKHDSKET